MLQQTFFLASFPPPLSLSLSLSLFFFLGGGARRERPRLNPRLQVEVLMERFYVLRRIRNISATSIFYKSSQIYGIIDLVQTRGLQV